MKRDLWISFQGRKRPRNSKRRLREKNRAKSVTRDMTRAYVLRARSSTLPSAWTGSRWKRGPLEKRREREREREREEKKNARRSSNSCATVQSVGTLYAYMSVQARRTRSVKERKEGEREERERERQSRGGTERGGCGPGGGAYQKNLWRVRRHFLRARRAFVRLLCG